MSVEHLVTENLLRNPDIRDVIFKYTEHVTKACDCLKKENEKIKDKLLNLENDINSIRQNIQIIINKLN